MTNATQSLVFKQAMSQQPPGPEEALLIDAYIRDQEPVPI